MAAGRTVHHPRRTAVHSRTNPDDRASLPAGERQELCGGLPNPAGRLYPTAIASRTRERLLHPTFCHLAHGGCLLPHLLYQSSKEGQTEPHRPLPVAHASDCRIRTVPETRLSGRAQGQDFDQSFRLAADILTKYGIPKSSGRPLGKPFGLDALRTRQVKGLCLDVPFEILKTTAINEGILTLASDLCGVTTFKEMRQIIRPDPDDPGRTRCTSRRPGHRWSSPVTLAPRHPTGERAHP